MSRKTGCENELTFILTAFPSLIHFPNWKCQAAPDTSSRPNTTPSQKPQFQVSMRSCAFFFSRCCCAGSLSDRCWPRLLETFSALNPPAVGKTTRLPEDEAVFNFSLKRLNPKKTYAALWKTLMPSLLCEKKNQLVFFKDQEVIWVFWTLCILWFYRFLHNLCTFNYKMNYGLKSISNQK